MNWIIKSIPNSITCLNLFSGCLASIAAFNGEFETAMKWILAAAVFDFLDGFAARLLKAYSAMGKELDSLADCISFGFAPSVLVYAYLSASTLPTWAIYSAFLLAIFSALRLAKFNIDERQTTSFIGLPTPANALFWITFITSLAKGKVPFDIPEWGVVALVPVFSLLLVSELPMFSLKIKSLSFSQNRNLYIFIAVLVLLTLLFKLFGVSLAMIFYVLLSAFTAKKA
ncbi:MAG: CDP-diacylglycerol--serine O-phosphatidyltransferase [Bacteroidales bacterium]